MARLIKWRHDVHSILARVRNSKTETWTRYDLEIAFCVKRASAQSLMKAIGNVDNLGGKHVVSRDSIISYLEAMIQADDLSLEHRARLDMAEPVARPRGIPVSVPDDLRHIMIRDLPQEVAIEPGHIHVRGADPIAVIENLLRLAHALQNDLDTAMQHLTPSRPHPDPIDDDLRQLFANLEAKETVVAAGAPAKT